MPRNKNILYITDIHISMDELPLLQQYFHEMEEFLRKEHMAGNISCLVVTGDLTCTGSGEEFKEAAILLHHLTENVLHLHSSQVYICPGNHDADTCELPAAFTHYRDFIRDFHGQDMTGTEEILQITAINSCTQCSLSEPDRAMLLEEDLFTCREPAGCQKVKLLILHHQPEVFQNKEKLYSILGNYDIVLYGHTHAGNVKITYVKDTLLINGRPFHAPEQTGLSSFHTIEINDEIAVITYHNKGDGYKITEKILTKWKRGTTQENGS